MSGAPDSQGDSSGDDKPQSEPALSPVLRKSIAESQHGRQIESTNTTIVYLRSPDPISPADEFLKFPPEVQEIVVEDFQHTNQNAITRRNRQQIFDFVTDILRLLLPFVLGAILIVGSILLIQSGLSNEGLVGLVATGIFEVFAVRDYKKRTDRK